MRTFSPVMWVWLPYYCRLTRDSSKSVSVPNHWIAALPNLKTLFFDTTQATYSQAQHRLEVNTEKLVRESGWHTMHDTGGSLRYSTIIFISILMKENN